MKICKGNPDECEANRECMLGDCEDDMTIDDDGVVNTPFLRTRYNYDMDKASDESGLFCADETRTQQQFKDECDINTIVAQFGLTGMLPTNLKVPLGPEFVDIMDYQTAINKIMEADDAFMQMPAHIRSEFQNDAGKFVDYVSDPANVEQARKWGLAVESRTVLSGSPEGANTGSVAPESKV